MLIEVGRKYKTRDGRIAKIKDIILDGRRYPAEGELDGESHCWLTDGRFQVDGNFPDWDLIEAIEPTPDDLIDQTCAAFAELRKNDGRVPAGKRLEMMCSGNWVYRSKPGSLPSLVATIDYRLVPIPAPVVAPESPRFKAGDRVRCVDLSDIELGPLNKSETYTVQSVQFDGEEWLVYFDGINGGWRPHRFELVSPVPRYSIVRENGLAAIRDSQNPTIEADFRAPIVIDSIDNCLRRLNGGEQVRLTWTLINPPRFTISTDPCGVLDSQRHGMILKCGGETTARLACGDLNSGGSINANQWQPLTRTAPLGPADIIVGVTILNNAVGHESLVLSKSASGISYCSIHAADAETDPTLYTASYEQLQRHGQYSNDHGATFQKCEKQVPA